MNAQDLLDLALGQLDGPAREHAERELTTHLSEAETLRRLTRAIDALADDGETFDPPPGLARRTVALVSERSLRRRTILDFVPITVPFRWGDIAVAAGVFFAGLLTLLPAVQRSRSQMEQAGCGYNLQQLGQALWQYGSRYNHYPFGPDKDAKAPSGTFAVMLKESGFLHDLSMLDCPCDGISTGREPLPDFQTACRLGASNPDRCKNALGCDYAYNVGVQHPQTGLVSPIAALHTAMIPMLSDQPSLENAREVGAGNSPNHGGRGQNVLYSDGHVGWHNTRRIGPLDGDLFLNARNQVAPGVGIQDAALLSSHVPFGGYTEVVTDTVGE